MMFHRSRLLRLHSFTGLESILAHCNRSAQGAGPLHYDRLARKTFANRRGQDPSTSRQGGLNEGLTARFEP